VNEQEWLELRKKGITGSDVAVIMGESPWKTKMELWKEKVGIFYQEAPWRKNRDNQAINMGHELEKIVAKNYARSINKWLIPGKFVEHGWMRGTPDFLFYNEPIGLEIKTTAYKKTVDKLVKGEFEKYWIWQSRWYMMLTDAQEWHLVALTNGQKMFSKVIERDMDIEEYMLEKCSDFWHGNVMSLCAPGD